MVNSFIMLNPYPEPRTRQHRPGFSINMLIKNNLLVIHQGIPQQKSNWNLFIYIGGILLICLAFVLFQVTKTLYIQIDHKRHFHCLIFFELPVFLCPFARCETVKMGSVAIFLAKTEFYLGRR